MELSMGLGRRSSRELAVGKVVSLLPVLEGAVLSNPQNERRGNEKQKADHINPTAACQTELGSLWWGVIRAGKQPGYRHNQTGNNLEGRKLTETKSSQGDQGQRQPQAAEP